MEWIVQHSFIKLGPNYESGAQEQFATAHEAYARYIELRGAKNIDYVGVLNASSKADRCITFWHHTPSRLSWDDMAPCL